MKKLTSCLFGSCFSSYPETRSRQATRQANSTPSRSDGGGRSGNTQQSQASRELQARLTPGNLELIQDPEKFYRELAEWAVPPEILPETNPGQNERAKVRYAEAHRRIRNFVENNSIELNLEFLLLRSLPPCIGELTNMRHFQLIGNRLENFPDSFWQLTNLTSLDLKYNRLQHIPDDIMNMTKMEVLNLQENPLGHVPENLGRLRHLISIRIDRENSTHPDFSIPNSLINHPTFNMAVRHGC